MTTMSSGKPVPSPLASISVAMGIKVPLEDIRIVSTTAERMQGRPAVKEGRYEKDFTVYCEDEFLGIAV